MASTEGYFASADRLTDAKIFTIYLSNTCLEMPLGMVTDKILMYGETLEAVFRVYHHQVNICNFASTVYFLVIIQEDHGKWYSQVLPEVTRDDLFDQSSLAWSKKIG